MVKKGKENKKKLRKLLLGLIFFLGFTIFLYPIASNVVHSMNQTRLVYDYKKEVKKLREEERKKKIKEAREYNRSIKAGTIDIKDPYEEDNKKQKDDPATIGKDQEDPGYISALNIKSLMGNLEIPKIGVNLPIYHGTSERVLQKGVGHIEGSSLPIGGKGSHTALTAHRGIPTTRLFRNLDRLELGDEFYIHNIDKTLAYKVDRIDIVEPWETERIKVDDNKDYASLITCEPYMINTHRLIVRGTRIAYIQDGKGPIEKEKTNLFYRYRDPIILLVSLILIILIRKRVASGLAEARVKS